MGGSGGGGGREEQQERELIKLNYSERNIPPRI